jgi:hypothetical protein
MTTKAERIIDGVMGTNRPAPKAPARTPAKPVLNEADHAAIAAKVAEALKPEAKPLHEMTDMERDRYANEVWARAGVIGGKK